MPDPAPDHNASPTTPRTTASSTSAAGSSEVPATPTGAVRVEPRGQRGLDGLWIPRIARDVSPEAPLIDRVLQARGVAPEQRDAFLRPSLAHLHDPSGIPHLDDAARRMLDAARAGEPIVIYGDYDVDGITATSILYHTLHHVAPDAPVSTYVPHRIEEGYGLNAEAIRELADQGARVVVSVDCGVTAREPARVARELGVDLIITDHHNPPESIEDLPDAFAVVHPRHPNSDYPFGDLPGAGVAYKLAWRLATLHAGSQRVNEPTRVLLLELLALAALGVVADVVPLVDENRVITRHGLGRVKQSTIPGLRALVQACGLDGEDISAEDVGFKIGPRLNACGRLGHAREAVELLTVARGAHARTIAQQLSTQNDERRRIAEHIEHDAIGLAEGADMTTPDRRAIVLAHEGWHPGVVGIVCSRLVERFHRPCILLCREADGACRGSGRSIDGFNLHHALESCAAHLDTFGGHDMAAGLRLHEDQLDGFVERFTQIANDRLQPGDLVRRIRFDTEVAISELTTPAVAQLERVGPFGRANPPVAVRLRGVRLLGPPTRMGADGRHLQLKLRDGDVAIRCVAWRRGDLADTLAPNARTDAIVRPKLNRWNGRSRVECELIDLAPIDA
ncbi:MAG: single-stranded-DNA-specific exonuclease RecJ [Planctomycetota bacterium]